MAADVTTAVSKSKRLKIPPSKVAVNEARANEPIMWPQAWLAASSLRHTKSGRPPSPSPLSGPPLAPAPLPCPTMQQHKTPSPSFYLHLPTMRKLPPFERLWLFVVRIWLVIACGVGGAEQREHRVPMAGRARIAVQETECPWGWDATIREGAHGRGRAK